tara:strand:- start:40 stop:504 length:465 start_codon:yes stop_codon:yes gene_type:complete
MIDTDKYEGHDLSTDKKMSDAIEYIQGSIFHDEDEGRIAEANAQLMADAPLLLAEVKRLRKELSKVEQERDKYDGALNIALEHLGYQGADHDEFCKEQYECNAYGDELLKCDNIECGGFLVNRYGDCISTISLSESAGCEDEDCCNYYKGSEEE